jgi:hypothetical protein
MKTFVVSPILSSLLSVLLSVQAFGATALPVKTCSSDLKKMDGSGEIVPTTMSVYKDHGGIHARVTQTVNGKTASYEDTAEISFHLITHPIDHDLNDVSDEYLAQLNLGERLLVHAYTLVNDPAMNGFFSAGLDLKAVRSVRVFQVGAATAYGMSAIIEASDKNGKVLGSFIGGFVVSPCK